MKRLINASHAFPHTQSSQGSEQLTNMVDSSSDDRVRSSSVDAARFHKEYGLDGLEFDSKEEAFSFYKQYAKSAGFSSIIKASRRSRISGKFIDAKFVCTRYGNDPESPLPAFATTIPVKKKRGRLNRSWSKTDCKAGMHVKRRQDGRWIVCSFIKEHNHDTFPDQGYYSRGHTPLALGNSDVSATAGRAKKMHLATSTQSGGRKKLDHHTAGDSNRFRSCQLLGLEEGDLQVLLDRFNHMQDENPNFFYAMDLNEEQRLRNVFWIDAKGRLDYSYFDDVVFLDTTYIKNDYKLPVVPFIGVNHHLQFLLLGCALVADQTKSTYVWLMQAWLRAMGGNAPKVILTDHDKALKAAVVEAFPDSRHCFCLWHILSKIPEKLGNVLGQHENFMAKFDECISKSYMDEQFEKKWLELVDAFNLRNNLWFQSLYEDRKKWVPTYMRGVFLAGMSTVQQSDSNITGPMSAETQGPHHFEEENQNSSTTKEVKRTKTTLREGYPETEISNTGRCYSWQQLGLSNIRVPSPECSYESQENRHRMEQLHSRTPALNSYFGTQQLMQGQLSSTGPPHDAHCITQQRMNRMGQLPFRPQSISSCYDIQDGLQEMDQPNAGSSQLLGMASKKLHSKHISK
ncbi:hypothetical protein V6Z11_A01G155900 [Gossypium hirsutum]